MSNNIILTSLKYLAIDVIGDVFYFPIWWYTSGLKKMVFWMGRSIKEREHSLGLGIWLGSLFKPMFGQYDWQGRIISFIFRFIFLIFRSFSMLVWLVVVAILFLVYLILPVFIVWQIIQQTQIL